MNYIRGAVVNAISAPYQYYKDINPSTLTGAIDVIVIQRPAPDGNGTELACSPFHVRFGKWQVLRPAEKKVNVSVNGSPIPYNMKIGDAGEAFFVFETEDDVPEDLITSPILQATTPTTEAAGAEVSGEDARFGAVEDGKAGHDVGEKSEEARTEEEDRIPKKHEEPSEEPVEEPEYLDLDGRPQAHIGLNGVGNHDTPKQSHHVPAFLKRSASRSTLKSSSYLNEPEKDRENSGDRTPEMYAQDRVVDEALRAIKRNGRTPAVDYHKDVALDMEGYHSGNHERQDSSRTIRSSDIDELQLPPSLGYSGGVQSYPITPTANEQESSSAHDNSSIHFPLFRNTSEPPPDADSDFAPTLNHLHDAGHSTSELVSHSHQQTAPPTRLQVRQQHQQEYMWEWGNFPQPSPMKTTFSKSGRIESPVFHASGSNSVDRWKSKTRTVKVRNGRLGGMRLPVLQDGDEEGEDAAVSEEEDNRGRSRLDKNSGRSYSVPPQSQADSSHKSKKRRDRKRWKEYEDFDEEEEDEMSRESRLFKDEGGSLSASKGDPTKFILSIEGQKVGFQLSLAGLEELNAERFQQLLVDFDSKHTVAIHPGDPSLTSPGSRYITRKDSQPLLDALSQWREAAVQKRNAGHALRPVSPSTDDSTPASPTSDTYSSSSDNHLDKPSLTHMRAKSEPPEQFQEDLEKAAAPSDNQKTTSSWVPWWGRSRRRQAQAAAPESNGPSDTQTPEQPGEGAAPTSVEPPAPSLSTADAVTEAVETTPVNEVKAEREPLSAGRQQPVKQTKYAKTLRLTSDQLKALNLQPGPNTITFSLSATGAVAATARIFVWESTDLVVVSDIDGTITKSDGLGHVFAMIGRDWTHLGVAKLYTDITRNGYKIMYLTSRAIGQADATRGYLKGIKQNNYQLPEGPVIMSPDRLMASLHREVVLRKPEVFKMACLRDIQRLFGEQNKYQFYAGFGNRITDALSYRTVNIPSARIFTIDSAGEVKMELLELAGYKSSYIHMTDLVDQMFPPIHRKWTPEYTDFNYWRAPVQEYPLPDFSPPSPALSARSDTSNQSTLARLRNFSLVGPRQSSMLSANGVNGGEKDDGEGDGTDGYRSNHLRQMSSFERLSSTLGFMTTVNNLRRSASPDSNASEYDSEDDDEATLSDGAVGRRRRKRERRRSMTSMPGSLMDEEDMHFSDDEGEPDDYEEEDGEHEGEEGVEEEAFDEDLLAAGEMQNVPFL
ncbi:nuclear elongation and deformation protein 1 [Ephemerocybe angulata]|uniref:Nuclear elongation and deformation protein 1 n=1 Tax=Ephemerocybe angulata TaxID=980116 RepID=A0A8H6ICP1_9AGAR|nr:nuclear elongation and deformation protein 1 [Tulosesus angulatus]